MHCKIIDHYFNICVETQLKEENLKYFLGTKVSALKLVYTSLPSDLNVSLAYLYCIQCFTICSTEYRSLVRDHQQIPFEFFKIIFLLIFPFPIFPLKISISKFCARDVHSKPFFTIRNSSPSSFIVYTAFHVILSHRCYAIHKRLFFIIKLFLT